MSLFFPPAGEVAYYLPSTDAKFFSLGLWSGRARSWIPILFTDKREIAAGQAARLSDGGFTYWAIPLEVDDEQRELAEWRAIPPPDSPEFRTMLGFNVGAHEPDDPNS